MKKKMVFLLCTALLFLGAACALADDYGEAVVDGRNSSKVHLREEATSNSSSLGLFFTGTEVEVRSDPSEKWVKVRMGGLGGYMNSSYLRRGSGRDRVGKAFQSGTVTAKNYAYFRNGPSTEHMVMGRINRGERVTVMGETSEHWYYIQYGNERGYISGNLVRLGGGTDDWDDDEPAYDPYENEYRDTAPVQVSAALPAGLPRSWVHMSGAGAWSTELQLDANGFFYGYFHDSEADRVYESDFSGVFTDVKRRDAYSYTMTLSGFHVFGTPGEAQARNGALYITQEPAGLEKGDTFVLYLPGTPLHMITEEERSWLLDNPGSTLRTYLLSNQHSGRGFVPDSAFR